MHLLPMQHEAAGLLGLRGHSALYTFPFLFCCLFSRGAGSVYGRAPRDAHSRLFVDALTTTPLVTPGFGFSRLRWGQLSLLLVGFLVTRVVCRSPSELLLETTVF